MTQPTLFDTPANPDCRTCHGKRHLDPLPPRPQPQPLPDHPLQMHLPTGTTMTTKPYIDTGREAAADLQDLAEADYYTARSAYRRGDMRRAVGLQISGRINSAAARAAYEAWRTQP